MDNVIDIGLREDSVPYDSFNGLSKILDRFKTKITEDIIVKELGVKILKVKLPSNLNKDAYYYNITNTKRLTKSTEAVLSPKIIRTMDYFLINDFQKRLFAYGVFKSIQLILRNTNKSIKNSCIVIDDANERIVKEAIYELAKHTKYLVLLSKDLKKSLKLRDYIISNYGVSPEITWDDDYAYKIADFIVTTREQTYKNKNIWYINNLYVPDNPSQIMVNDITFKVPWEMKEDEMSCELLGAILGQMGERDIEKSLNYNGIILDNIKFNHNILSVDNI